jgi:hypothetical protein
MPPQRSIASFFHGGAASAAACRPLPLPRVPGAPDAAPRELPSDAEAGTPAQQLLPARADDDDVEGGEGREGGGVQAVCEEAEEEAVPASPPPLRVFSRKRRLTAAPDGCARGAALICGAFSVRCSAC